MFVVLSASAEPSVKEDAGQNYTLIEFFSQGSVESKVLRDYMEQPDIQNLIAQNFQHALSDIDQDKELALDHKVTRVPLLLVLDANGREIDRLAGVSQIPTTKGWFSAILSGQSVIQRLQSAAAKPDATVSEYVNLAEAYRQRFMTAEVVAVYRAALSRYANLASTHLARQLVRRMQSASRHTPELLNLMREVRDGLLSTSGDIPPARLMLIFDLNAGLGENSANLALYKNLPEVTRTRDELFSRVLPALIEARDYQLATSAFDLESLVNSLYPRSLQHRSSQNAEVVSSDEEVTAVIGQVSHAPRRGLNPNLVQLTAGSIEALLAVNRPRAAKRLAGRLLDHAASQDLVNSLRAAAERAASPCTRDFILWLDQEFAQLIVK
jgi:hypothetical protein